jgi:hypothetical protein
MLGRERSRSRRPSKSIVEPKAVFGGSFGVKLHDCLVIRDQQVFDVVGRHMRTQNLRQPRAEFRPT